MAWHIIFVDFWSIYRKNEEYCDTSKDGDGRHPRFGLAILSPVLLSSIFVLVHWWKTESNQKNKLITFPLVIGQMWPQYRIVRILYFGLIKQNRIWKAENEDQKKNVSSLGMFWILCDDTSGQCFLFLFSFQSPSLRLCLKCISFWSCLCWILGSPIGWIKTYSLQHSLHRSLQLL